MYVVQCTLLGNTHACNTDIHDHLREFPCVPSCNFGVILLSLQGSNKISTGKQLHGLKEGAEAEIFQSSGDDGKKSHYHVKETRPTK